MLSKKTCLPNAKKSWRLSHVTRSRFCRCILVWGGLLTLMSKVLVQDLENSCNCIVPYTHASEFGLLKRNSLFLTRVVQICVLVMYSTVRP